MKANRAELITALMLLVLLTGGAAGAWIWIWTSATIEWELRAPVELPDWLTPGPSRRQHWARSSLDQPQFALQEFATQKFQLKSLPTVMLGQVLAEVEIDTRDKTPVTVDGTEGWLWHLGPEDLMEDWVDPRDRPQEELYGSRRVYMDFTERRVPPWPATLENGSYHPANPDGGLIPGPAIPLQWNRDGVHYVLIAQDMEPMSVDILLSMANSLGPYIE